MQLTGYVPTSSVKQRGDIMLLEHNIGPELGLTIQCKNEEDKM